MPCFAMNRRSWLAAATSADGFHANSGLHAFFECRDKPPQDWRHVSLLQAHFNQCESLLVVRGAQRIAKLPRRECAKPSSAPEIGELGKRPCDGCVVSRIGEKRLQHFPSLIV